MSRSMGWPFVIILGIMILTAYMMENC